MNRSKSISRISTLFILGSFAPAILAFLALGFRMGDDTASELTGIAVVFILSMGFGALFGALTDPSSPSGHITVLFSPILTLASLFLLSMSYETAFGRQSFGHALRSFLMITPGVFPFTLQASGMTRFVHLLKERRQ